MSGTIVTGPMSRSLRRDKEGHRTYEVTHIVQTDSTDDGPTVVLSTPGLPTIGSLWGFGNDLDVWALCHPDISIDPKVANETTDHWVVKQKFSTKPLTRCQDESIEDPLLEPQKVSGSFVRGTIEATEDRNGVRIATSSHELVRGPQVEFDDYNPDVVIVQNVAALGLSLFTGMVNTVNDAPLWGLPARTIKLSGAPWSRKLYGICDFYYTRQFEFQVNKLTFDRSDILDEGTKALRGKWSNADPPVWTTNAGQDKNNPAHFSQFKDPEGENIPVLLDGNGEPALNGNPVQIPMGTVEYYPESNFLLLGITTDLEAK